MTDDEKTRPLRKMLDLAWKDMELPDGRRFTVEATAGVMTHFGPDGPESIYVCWCGALTPIEQGQREGACSLCGHAMALPKSIDR